MENRTVVVTGGNSGLGYQCAMNIAKSNLNYTLVLACRSKEKAEIAIGKIKQESGNPNIFFEELDLADLASVRCFYSKYMESNYPKLYSLVCNAGFNLPQLQYTKDGFEATFGVCHLGHFLLANLMMNQISDNGRIVFVSSDMHQPPKIMYPKTPVLTDAKKAAFPGDNGKLSSDEMKYRYPIAKLGNILCVHQMADRIKVETNKHVTVNAFNPGLMTDTNFMSQDINKHLRLFIVGAATILSYVIRQHGSSVKSGKYLAEMVTGEEFEGVTRGYYFNGKPAKISEPAQDDKAAKVVWKQSADLVGLKQEEALLSIN